MTTAEKIELRACRCLLKRFTTIVPKIPPINPPHKSASTKNQLTNPEELNEAKTDRAREALMNWHERLKDLYKFKKEKGHSK